MISLPLDSRIFVAGHNGLVGSAVLRRLEREGFTNVLTAIRQLAELVGSIVHPEARLVFDTTKPDGMPFKQLNVDWLHRLGWKHTIDLEDGIRTTYDWYLENEAPK